MYFSSWYTNSPLGYLEGTNKWVYWPYNDLLQFYDLANDPGEKTPRSVSDQQKEQIVADLLKWQRESRIVMHPRRFRERLLYDHWRAFSSGRSAWAYYVP